MPVPSCCTYCIRSGPSTIFILSHPIGSPPAALVFSYKVMAGAPIVVVARQVLCWAVYYPPPMPQQVPPTPLAKKKIGNLGCCPPRRVFIHQLLCPRHAKIPFPPFCRRSSLNALFDQKASRRPSQFTLWSIGRARALTGHCTIRHIGWRVSSFCWSLGRSRTSLKSQGPHVRQQKSQSQSLPLRSCS